MASKIRIFRSTGAIAPSSLEYGELAVTIEQGTAGTSANKAGRLFVGNASGNPVELGGEYTYKLMDHTHGELINSSVAIVDSGGQINGWNVAGILTATRTAFTDTVTTNLNVTGISTFVGQFNLNGNVTIGDNHTDILTINSRTGFNTDVTLNTSLLISGISTFTGIMDVNGGANISGGSGLVVSADGINVSGGSTFNSNVVFTNTIDVDGQAIFDDITVSAASTFTGVVDMNGGLDVSGGETVLSSATVSDLTDNRVVIAGASGALEDSGNLTFDGTILAITGNQTISGTIDVDGQGIFDDITVSAAATFAGVVDINNNVIISGTIDVDGQGIFDDIVVSASSTFFGPIDAKAGLGVTGGETTLASATISDLTNNRVVIAGASGALEDDVNLTYDGTDLSTNSLKIGDLTSGRVLIAGTSGSVDDDADLTFSNRTLTTTDLSVTSDARVGGALTVYGNLTVEGTETIINVERLDVQDKTVGVASTSTANNTTADGGGFFVHGGGDGNKEIFWYNTSGSFEVNQSWLPRTDDSHDLGSSSKQWRDLYINGTADVDSLYVSGVGTITTADINGGNIDGTTIGAASSAAGTFTTLNVNTITSGGTSTLATVDINAGNIDGTIIGAASSAAGTFTNLNYTTLTGGNIVATGNRIDAGDVTFTNLRVTGVSTVASLFLSSGTNTNGIAYFDANGQVTSTATPSAGIQTSNYILTTNASGVPSWTDTIDGGQF